MNTYQAKKILHARDGSVTCQRGKAMPIIIIAVVALVLGASTFAFRSGQTSDSSEATNQNNAELAKLQENLTTSLALPIDFKRVSEFSLIDANNEQITESAFDNTWSIVFFGYTHCPDVCPITLQVLKDVVNKLDDNSATVPQVVFMSVDPVRDTSEIMKKYIGYFNEDFIGITGDVKTIHDVTRSLGIVASFTANETDPENYTVDHTASLLLIDPQRRVRAKITPPFDIDSIVSDYLAIIAELS